MKNKTYNKRKCWLYFQSQFVDRFLCEIILSDGFDAEHYQKLAKDLHERERKIKAAREDPGP